MKTVTSERRKFVRNTAAPGFEIGLLQAHSSVPATSVNFSEGGLCFRLRHMLEIRSLVRLRLTPEAPSLRSSSARISRPMECAGRVAWVMERLDLGDATPCLYDVGIEFVDPPPVLRQLMARTGSQPSRTRKETELPPALIRDRRYVPRLEREAGHAFPWHLIVLVDGSPCFSGRYVTKRQAVGAWTRFKRQQAKHHAEEGNRSS